MAEAMERTPQTDEEKGWVKSWMSRAKKVELGKTSTEELMKWIRRKKVRNGVNVTRERIRRALLANENPRRETWITVAAEPGQKKEDLSPLGMLAMAHAHQELYPKYKGQYDIEWHATPSGLVVVSIHVWDLTARTEEIRRSRARSKFLPGSRPTMQAPTHHHTT